MGVFIDTPSPCPATATGAAARVFTPGRLFAHLCADTEAELIAYAVKIGCDPKWIQFSGTKKVHFDITGARLKHVLADPTVEVMDRRAYVMRRYPEMAKKLLST